jgi:hypothetical protein
MGLFLWILTIKILTLFLNDTLSNFKTNMVHQRDYSTYKRYVGQIYYLT